MAWSSHRNAHSCSFRRATLSVGALLISCFVASAQGAIFEAAETPIPPTTMQPFGFGDFDGDGDLDIYGRGAPYILINDGDGRFVPKAAVGIVAGPTIVPTSIVGKIAIADFNADGRDDFAEINFVPSASAGYLWKAIPGASGFTATALPFISGRPGACAAADIDGDGAPDLVVSRSIPAPTNPAFFLPAPAEVLLNVGGVLVASGSLGLGSELTTSAFAFHDMDGDGDQDAVIGFGAVRINTVGVFGALNPASGSGGIFAGGQRVIPCRLDGDAFPDVVTFSDATIGCFFGGPGGLAVGPALTSPSPGVYPFRDVQLIDSDGDGVEELYVSTIYGRLERFDLIGGTLVQVSSEPLPPSFSYFSADTDGDGDRDYVHQTHQGSPAPGGVGSIAYFGVRAVVGTGGLKELAGALPPRSLNGGLAIADFDDDGDLDLAGTEADGLVTRLVVAINDGFGTFSWTPHALGGAHTAGLTARVVAGDFDGDGDADLAIVESVPSPFVSSVYGIYVRQATSIGGGAWSSNAPSLYALDVVRGAIVGDFDADGFDDLVFTLSSQGGVHIARGGAGGLAPSTLIAAFPNAREVASADFDGDGDLDLVVAGTTTKLLLNDGGGAFSESNPFGATNASRVSAGDVDQNGTVDLWLDTKLWLRFGATWVYWGIGTAGANGARSFDFDGDGDVDTIFDSGAIVTAIGPGSTATTFAPISSQIGAIPVDLDRDGDLDLLVMQTAAGASLAGVPALLLNRSRQLTLDMPLRPGRATHVGLHGASNGAYYLFGALGTANIPAPPFGTILLDASSAVLLSAGVLDSNGRADAASFLPSSFAALAGLEVDLQGIVDTVAGPKLTNGRRATITIF